MNFRPVNSVVLITLIQSATVVAGFLLVCVFLKAQGYPSEDYRWNPVSLAVREHGLLYLGIPLLWGVLAVWLDQSTQTVLPGRVIRVAGIIIVLWLISFYIKAAVDSGYVRGNTTTTMGDG